MHPETFVTTPDARLCVQTVGNASDPAMLLVAGTSCSMDWWPPELCAELASHGWFVIRYDQRDTGRSSWDPPGAPSYALPDLARDAVAVLDGLGVATARWVGFSQGGWVAQLAALDHPDRVESLVLVSTRATGHGPADADLPELSDRLLAAWASVGEPDWDDPRSVVESLVEGERSLAGDPFDEEGARAIAAACVARADQVRSALTNHPMAPQGARWRERLGTVAVPTVVVHGDADPLFPPGNAAALAAAIPGAHLRLLAGVGHELPRRAWAEAVGILARDRDRSLAAATG
jgi:pimeloyl-ACP methyl ester carboxylesterase